MRIVVGARSSKLSQAQVCEVLKELQTFVPEVIFSPIFLETTGDKDLQSSLRNLGKTDFFTKEIDEMQLNGKCRIGIHSAKDLPDPLAKGLVLVAMTKGVDSSDSLVLRAGQDVKSLPERARIGVSCQRREEAVKALRSDLCCVDIRGTIDSRLAQLQRGDVDGVVVAESALIRLQIAFGQGSSLEKISLKSETAPFQGRLAVVAVEGDQEMAQLFSRIDAR